MLVSLHPLVLDKEEIEVETYIKKLETNGWEIMSKQEVESM